MVKLEKKLAASIESILPDDPMAEAGRKALLADYLDMLAHEDGAKRSEDIEDVHQMRVATRRMRSLFQLLGDRYKPKQIAPHVEHIRLVASKLGRVRDLDVLIDALSGYQAQLDMDEATAFQPIIDRLQRQQRKANIALVAFLETPDHATFKKSFGRFLSQEGKGAVPITDDHVPHQVRHVLPTMIYDHLGQVRAYDVIMPDPKIEDLHALRITFKRLRYVLTHFRDVLGASAQAFLGEVKAIQDHLGRLNDIDVATLRLNKLKPSFDATTQAALQRYLDSIHAEEEALRQQFEPIWRRFNSRTVQRQLADALLVLR